MGMSIILIKKLEQTLKIITKEHRPCYLLGDYNINLLKQNVHLPTKQFLDTLLSYGFYPLINKPTRITTETTTLIDNILTNIHDIQTKSGIWTVDISDHLPIFTVLPCKTRNYEIKRKFFKHNFTQENLSKFKHELQQFDWDNLVNLPDVNSMYARFTAVFQHLYNNSFPIQNKIIKASEIHRPWLTKAIRNSINKKHSLYKNYQKLRSEQSYSVYKIYRNKLTTILRKAEKRYYLQKLENVKSNLAKTWKILNAITSRNVKKGNIEEIISNNKTIQDQKLIANSFNNFFSNVGTNLAAKIPATPHKFTEYLKTNIPESIFCTPTDESEIKSVIHALKNSYSKGHDDLSTKTIKDCCEELARPLCYIFNKSIQDGIVPDDLKIAKVIPIYKSEDKKLVSNYRPVSVLPAFSKILEKLVYNRVLDFIEKK